MPRGMTLLPPAPAPVLPPVPPDRGESGLTERLGVGVGALALVLSLGYQLVARQLVDPSQQADTSLRVALVVTLTFYVLLGAALTAFCVRMRVGLVWVRGQLVDALVLGIPLGLLAGGVAVGLNSALSGHLASDPNVEALVGGGGALRVLLTVLVTAVLAPLVEETVFRGVLAGTLLARGPAPAVWVSAIAFAVWHMNPTSLRYYVFMGLLLATLWRKRGLVASMTAHACFNGVLTLAAIAATTGGGHLTTVGALRFSLPGGWHEVAGPVESPDRHLFQGPAGAALAVLVRPGFAPTVEQLREGLAGSETGNALQTVVPGTERVVQVSGGQAVTADVLVAHQRAHVLDVVAGGSAYQLLVVTAGSPAAEQDWTRLVGSLMSTGG